MSKIQAALAKITEVEPKKDESIVDQSYMKRLAIAVGELSDKDWDSLSADEQDWTNDASDATNAKKDITVFKDYVKPEEPTSRRRRAAEEPAADTAATPQKGEKVKVTTKRGKVYEGTVVDPDDGGALILHDGKEELEIPLEGLTIESQAKPEEPTSRRRRAAEEPETPAGPAVGDTVEIKTKRGKVALGNVVEIDDKVVAIKTISGEVDEYDVERLESITVKVKNSGGDAGKGERDPAAGGKTPKTSKEDNGGVSVTTRARELMCDDLSASKDDIMKQLKKEGLEFKENTIQLIFGDVQKLVKMLRERKLMK